MGVPTIIIPFLFGILHEINHPAIGDPANQAQVLLQELIKGQKSPTWRADADGAFQSYGSIARKHGYKGGGRIR